MRPAAGGIHTVCVYIDMIYIPTNISILLSQRSEQDVTIAITCVCASVLCFCLLSVWLDTYICDVYLCSVCMRLLEIHFQPPYLLDLGAWSYCSLTSLRLLDLA